MSYRIERTCAQVDWAAVCAVIRDAGLATHTEEITRKAFENSYSVVFVFDGETLIGVGRAISDGVYQAAIYDIAVLPSYQGCQVGRLIMDEIHRDVEGFTLLLYASPGKEGFYERFGYRRLRTGMARFSNEAAMRSRGFID